jgi:hypothetical protein
MGTVLHPTAGVIPDVSNDAPPGPLAQEEKALLRSLAERVRAIAEEPRQATRRAAWIAHNDLRSLTPTLLVFPEDSWIEIIGEKDLAVAHPFWRQCEWYLRMIIWRRENVDDDFVVEPEIPVALLLRRGGWGVDTRTTAPLKRLEDMEKLTYPDLQPDESATSVVTSALSEVFRGILPVKVLCPVPGVDLFGEAAMLRGWEQCLVDMHDNPKFLHRIMAFVARGLAGDLDRLERGGFLTLNNGNQYTDTGGIGFTAELPRPSARGGASGTGPVRLSDLWGHGVALELSGVSPAQHEEFLLEHQIPLLDRFGLVAYACQEPSTHEVDMLKRRVRRLRRVLVGPQCDIGAAAAALGDKLLLAWKATPSILADVFHPDAVRSCIREALEKARGCRVEIILKDTFTVRHDPARISEWTRIAREEIERATA